MAKKRSIKTVEVAGGVVVDPDGRVAVVQQVDGTWSLPKGRVKKGERRLAAAYREIRQEIGIPRRRLTLVMKFESYERFSFGKDRILDCRVRKRITLFLFTTSVREVRTFRHHEIRWAKFVSFFDVPPLLTHPEDQRFLRAQQPAINARIPIVRSSGVL